VNQAGEDDESSAASSDVGSFDSTDVPPATVVLEEADGAGPAGPTWEPAGLPQPVMQDTVSSNEVLLLLEQFSENRENLALFAHAVAHCLTKEALADFPKLSVCKAPYRRRFSQRACLGPFVYFESPTSRCSRGMCDSRLKKDSRQIGAHQNTAPSPIRRQRQWVRAVSCQVPAS